MAEIPPTYEALKEAVIREQVMKTYRKELFLAERQYETLNQLAEAADRFEEAHSQVGPTERNVRAHTGDRQWPNGRQETTTGRKAIMTRMFLSPRRLPVGTTARHPRKNCVFQLQQTWPSTT